MRSCRARPGRTRWPARNTTCPRFRSSPAKRRFCPALLTAPAATRTPPSVAVARSCITTVSAPAGITPPVKMRTHSPARASPSNGLPRTTRRRLQRRLAVALRSAKRTAQPSIAELSWPGTSIGETCPPPARGRAPARTCTRSVAVTGVEELPDQRTRPVDRHRVRDRSRPRRRFHAGFGICHGAPSPRRTAILVRAPELPAHATTMRRRRGRAAASMRRARPARATGIAASASAAAETSTRTVRTSSRRDD